nr:nucleotide exchange factor GrpE [Xanthomonadales bacterium]NIX11742.1 nucleotide exchange factor GrpE [Xanthomonadales bacterium]
MTDKPENRQEEEEVVAEATAEQEGEAQEGVDTPAELDEYAELQTALGAAEQELAEHRDAMLRMQAEMENLRKRLIRDLERSRKFALERFMRDLLPVCD